MDSQFAYGFIGIIGHRIVGAMDCIICLLDL